MATADEKRAADLRTKVAQAKTERLQNAGNGLFAATPSQQEKDKEDTAVYNKLQNLREEEAENLEKRGKGYAKGGRVTGYRGYGKAKKV